jgi:hypothetical protein
MNRKSVFLLGKCLLATATLLLLIAPPAFAQEENQTTTIEHQTGFYYTVQKGDTLWDISERFADAPWYWPELWEKNNQVANPHRIYPGDRLRLFYSEGVDKIIPPPPPVVEEPMETPPEPAFFAFAGVSIDRYGFVRKENLVPNGRVLRGKFDRSLFNKGDLLLLQPEGPIPFAVGVEYCTYRIEETFTDPETGEYEGQHYFITGIVRITDIQSDFATAEVVQSFREVESGNLLMPYFPKSPKIMLVSSEPGVEGKIIGSEVPEQLLLGQYHAVFLNKGSRDGLKPGQFYELYKEPEDNIIDASLEYVPSIKVPRGQLLVIFTEPETATAIITNGIREIDAYARFQTPTAN